MKDYVRLQTYISQEAQMAIKMYCAKKSIELGEAYKITHFNLDLLDFINNHHFKGIVPSNSDRGNGIVAFNMLFPKAKEKMIYKLQKIVTSQVDEEISIRRMLTTGILLFLKQANMYKATELKGVTV